MSCELPSGEDIPESPLLGPTRKSVGCDEERFISPEESRLRVFGRGRLPLFLLRRYDIYFWHLDEMQSSAKYCKVRASRRRGMKASVATTRTLVLQRSFSSLIHCRGAAELKGRSY